MSDELDELARSLFREAREEQPRASVREAATRAVREARRAAVRRFTLGAAAALALAAGVALALRPSVLDGAALTIARERLLPSERARDARRDPAVNPQPDLPGPRAVASGAKSTAARAASAAPPRELTLAEEVALLEQARGALERRSAREALAILERHSAHGGGNRLAAEAAVLRIEALFLAERRAEAARVADVFLRDHADSPLADRVRKLSTQGELEPEHESKGQRP